MFWTEDGSRKKLHYRTWAQEITGNASVIVLEQLAKEKEESKLQEVPADPPADPPVNLSQLAASFPSWIKDRDARLEKLLADKRSRRKLP